MKKGIVTIGLIVSLFTFIASPKFGYASTYFESSDSGQLLSSAQIIYGTGQLDSISGSLSGFDDVDLYKINISSPNDFSVNVISSLSSDNDTMLWLFDSNGVLVKSDDDSVGLIPQFKLGELAGYSSEAYYLGFSLYKTTPVGNPLSSWNSSPRPQQEGAYVLNLTGTSPVAPVPVPGAIFLLGSGLVGLVGIKRKKY